MALSPRLWTFFIRSDDLWRFRPSWLMKKVLRITFWIVLRRLLKQLLYRAWLKWVALQHQHRPSFAGLRGTDVNVQRADLKRLTPLQLSRQSALQLAR